MRLPAFIPTLDSTTLGGDGYTCDFHDGAMYMLFPMPGEFAVTPIAGDQTEWPVQVPLPQVVKWWWRVKKWKLTMNTSDAFSYWDGLQIIIGLEASESMRAKNIDECDWTESAVISGAGDDTLGYVVTLRYLYRKNGGLSSYRMNNDTPAADNVIVPKLAIELSLTGYIGGSDYLYEATTSNRYLLSGEPGISTEVIPMDGINIGLAWEEGSASVGDIYWTLEPYEFFEYRDADGNNPIWDASTGAQLRSVVTGETI